MVKDLPVWACPVIARTIEMTVNKYFLISYEYTALRSNFTHHHHRMAKKYTEELILEQEIKDSFFITSLNGKKEVAPSIHRLRYHRIYFMRQASGALYIDERIFQLTGPSLFLLSKGQSFTFQPESRFEGYELSF